MAEANGTMNSRASSPMNGRQQRKQLSDQLDRLDTIIDALAEALPGAVADACKEGARSAVKEAIVEILATPELRALIVPPRTESIVEVPLLVPAQVPVPQRPNHWDILKARLAAMRDGVRNSVNKVKKTIVGRFNAIRDTVAAIGIAAGEKIPARRILLTALGVGLVVGGVCYVVPQEIAAGISGLSAAGTTIAAQVGSWLKNAARRVGLVM
jgi:hypothetical protein